jgi:hypothetical protein
MLRIEPAEPMLSMEPALPMLKIEPALPMLRMEPTLPMLKMLPTLKALPKLLALNKPGTARAAPNVPRCARAFRACWPLSPCVMVAAQSTIAAEVAENPRVVLGSTVIRAKPDLGSQTSPQTPRPIARLYLAGKTLVRPATEQG